MIKPSFGKKNNVELETNKMFYEEVKNEVNKNEIKEIKCNDDNLSILNKDTVKYIIKEFPDMSVKIKESLLNLANTLENTIDYIEDESSKVVKKDRNFNLSDSYRKISIEVYDMVKDISNYTKWICTENETYDKNNNNVIQEVACSKIDECNEDDVKGKDIGIEIYKDFTLKNPKVFKINENCIEVENWDDLIVKTAEILNKKYKDNKKFKPIQNNVKVDDKKSNENVLRDTVIDMLNEYRINLKDFKVIVD